MVTQSLNLDMANVSEMESGVRVIRKAFPVSRGLFSACFMRGWRLMSGLLEKSIHSEERSYSNGFNQ